MLRENIVLREKIVAGGDDWRIVAVADLKLELPELSSSSIMGLMGSSGSDEMSAGIPRSAELSAGV